MNTYNISLPADTYIINIEPFKSNGIPTNSIIHKMVTGCGATALELSFPRNSIIIEPNLPVILGKCRKLNGNKRKYKIVQGVYEGIQPEHITQYLNNRKGFKKIMTTPEGFDKVAQALGEAMYQDYFLLFDECEKAIQDVDFRSAIVNPIDAFFKFDNKAFVSATPLLPSDPRFKDFAHVIVKPDYDFKEPIRVLTTNNVTYQLKLILDHYGQSEEDKDRKIFMFFKSTKRIRNIIKGLKLTDYAVYCSEKSVKELRIADIDNAYDSINNKFAKYNFLTSRFYSAVDIDYKEYNCDPIIIMISDVIAVEHSVIDPTTESIQICGRFRKPEKDDGEDIAVKKDIYHISNYKSNLTSFSDTEVMAILEDKRKIHDFISTYKPKSGLEYINRFIEEILNLNGFKYFLREKDGELNHFMVDNFIYAEQVKRHYKSNMSLIDKYNQVEHFKVDAASKYHYHALTDQELLEIKDNSSLTTINNHASECIRNIMKSGMDSLWQSFNIAMLRSFYPEQVNLIETFGFEDAAALNYDINKICQHLEDAKGLKRMLPILKFIKRMFEIEKGYSSNEIESLLSKGIEETGLTDLKPDVKLLREGALLSERRTIGKDDEGNSIKGYVIQGYVQSF
ncbi:MAG: hypothetical protein ACTHMI_13425 [Mucilaginibacter sp.]